MAGHSDYFKYIMQFEQFMLYTGYFSVDLCNRFYEHLNSCINVMPLGETGQWELGLSHCGHWHWTVIVNLSPIQFRVALVRSPRLLVQLPSVSIWGYLLEQCPVVMTLIPLLVTNGDFFFTIHVWDSSRFVTIQFETAALLYLQVWDWSRFGTIQVWDWSRFGTIQVWSEVLKFWSTYSLGCVPHRVLYWIWTGLPSRGYPANVFKKLWSRREALSFSKSIPVLLKVQ